MNAWPTVRLGAVVTQRKEFITVDDLVTYKRPRVRLHAKGIVLRDEVTGASIKTKKQQVCRPGELLVAEIDAKVGGFGILPQELAGAIVSSHYFLFVPDSDRLDVRFLGWFIKTPSFRDQVEAQGSTNYAAIRPRDVLDYEMPLPPLEEQRRIVTRIQDAVDLLKLAVQERDTAVQEAVAVRPAFVTRLFECLTTAPRLPIASLGSDGCNPIQIGPFGAQLHRTEFTVSGVPVLNVGNVWAEALRLDRLDYVTSAKADQLKRYSLKAGDLLFARSGATLGKVCIVPNQCDGWLMTGHLFRVRFDPKRVLNSFVFAALRDDQRIKDAVMARVRGATRPGYNTSLLGCVELPVPSLDKQAEIVQRIEMLEHELIHVRRLQQDISLELKALLPSILDRAFRGEL